MWVTAFLVILAWLPLAQAVATFHAPSGPPPWVKNSHAIRPAKRSKVQGDGATSQPPADNVAPAANAHSSPPVRTPVTMEASSRGQQMAWKHVLEEAVGAPSVHQQLGLQWTQSNARIKAPPPMAVVDALRACMGEGTDPAEVLDSVSRSRAALSVRHASRQTYISHLHCICAVCDLLCAHVVPASIETLRRYTGVCNNAVTLRGQLAAWQLLHVVLGHTWLGSKDPFIRAAQAGILRWQPQGQPRKAIQKDLALAIVRYCFNSSSERLVAFGIMAALAYLFAMRVPSEALRQFSANLLSLQQTSAAYGPVRRKGSDVPVVLKRACVCQTKYAPLCPHSWASHLAALPRSKANVFATWSCSTFNCCLREVLSKLGVPQPHAYSSHDFRRGCARDILQTAGPAAMLKNSGWKTMSSALHYVSQDDVDRSIVASALIDNSDEDQ